MPTIKLSKKNREELCTTINSILVADHMSAVADERGYDKIAWIKTYNENIEKLEELIGFKSYLARR